MVRPHIQVARYVGTCAASEFEEVYGFIYLCDKMFMGFQRVNKLLECDSL